MLAILSGIALNQGRDVAKNTQITEFVTKLQIVQYKVNDYYEKGEAVYNNLGKTILSSMDNYSQMQEALIAIYGNADSINNYKYFDEEELIKLGIEHIDIPIIINFETRDVIGIEGIKRNDQMYYSLQQLGESYAIAYNPGTENVPDFSLEKRIYGLSAEIEVKDITYNGITKKGIIYYGQVTNANTTPPEVSYWKETSNSIIQINKTGIYAVKLVVDNENKGTQNETAGVETIEVTLCNEPKLADDMVPVVYIDEENEGHWEIVNENEGEWYDYSTDKKKWANASLQSGLELEEDGKTIRTLGAMFVWIPRYAYKSENENIKIKFLNTTLDIPTDNDVDANMKKIERNEENHNENYVIPECFTNNEKYGIWCLKENNSNLGEITNSHLITENEWQTTKRLTQFEDEYEDIRTRIVIPK